MKVSPTRYQFKPDPYSSHSVMLRWLGQGSGRTLLDVGAADGLLSGKFTRQGWKVTAIERDLVLAQAGAASCDRMIVANLDEGLPELDARYDAIVFGDVLEHLADPRSVLGQSRRFLAPEGLVVVSVPNVAHLIVRLSLLFGRFDYIDRGILDESHLRFFTQRSLRQLISDAGLRVTRFTATPAPLYQVLPERFHRSWLAVTHTMNASIAHCLPRLLGYQFVAMASRAESASAP